MITHSSGNFVVTNIRNHHLYTLQICMICVAVISMLSSIVAQKPLITHLRMCYAWKYHSKKQFRNEILLHFVTRWRYKDERKTGDMLWIIESLFRLWDICKPRTTPIFPPRGSVFLFPSRTRLVLIRFLHNTIISLQPSLSSFHLIWNDISPIVTFLVTNIPQNYSKAEIRANE